MKEILEYLKKHTFFIATCDGDQPRVRPFGAVAEFEGKLYIVTSNRKKCYKQMLENPKIEISAMGDDRTWLRLEAKVIHDSRREARARMLEENKRLSSLYSADDKMMEVLYLQDVTAQLCSSAGEPNVIRF
jgi:uncharacterized pyridoxamine 5'-phosphate oxidase family protein